MQREERDKDRETERETERERRQTERQRVSEETRVCACDSEKQSVCLLSLVSLNVDVLFTFY